MEVRRMHPAFVKQEGEEPRVEIGAGQTRFSVKLHVEGNGAQ